MNPRSLRRILTTVLLSSLPATALVGCADTVSSASEDAAADSSAPTDSGGGDTGRDVPPTDVPPTDAPPTDVPPTDVPPADVPPADVPPADVPPDRFCGMCGCDFTGRLEGSGELRPEHCAGAPADAGAGSDGGADGGIDGGADAATLDPATCEIDCNRACASVTVYGFGISRPWAGSGFPGGGGVGAGTCSRASATRVSCVAYVPCGRRTEGQRDLATGDDATGWLLRAAFLEAQSVGAFERMADELRAHGAPASLVRGALRSARDEREHAALVASLCAARGADAVPADETPRAVRDLASLAVENAAEGCAGETWGALLALHQAALAEDEDVRRAMTRIARDEVRHAALSWALHRWALGALPGEDRDRADRACARAWDAIERAVAVEPPPELARPLGLPDAATATAMARALRSSLGVV